MPDGYQILSLDEIEPVLLQRQQARILTVRRLLGFRAAGVNGWIGDEGERVVPPHTEESGSEELYVVVRGRAAFTVDGETVDAPAGTLVHTLAGQHRAATSEQDGTIVVAIGGGIEGQPFQVFAWEDYGVADALRREGRMDEGRAVLAAALEQQPESWGMAYNAACWEALAGNADGAFDLLRRALALDEAEVRKWAKDDDDLDALRDDPRWHELLG
jgi:mannose-6-phosphate isomerase-like protein (cupin superfamily)